MSWILEYFVSICGVYKYVRLVMSSYVVSTSMLGVSHAVQNEKKV